MVGRDSKQPLCSHRWDFCNLTATCRLFRSWAEAKHALRWLTTLAPSSERFLPASHCNYLCIVFSSILSVSRKSGIGPNLLALKFRAFSSSVDLQEEGCRDGRKLSQYSYISHRDGFDLPDHYDYWLVGSKITEKEKKQDCSCPSQLLTASCFVIALGPGTSRKSLCIFSRRQWPRHPSCQLF